MELGMAGSREARLAALRGRIAAIEAGTWTPTPVLPFGDPAIDGCFPGGGLPLGGWHEVTGAGLEDETSAAPAAFVGLLLRPLVTTGAIVWVARRSDLFAPGLAGLGFPAERLIQVCAVSESQALAVLEEALATPGVAAAVGEVETVSLIAGRRLQLACEKSGAAGLILHRRPYGGQRKSERPGSAAASRWKITSAPSVPAAGSPGLGAARWDVELVRCRGGRQGAWTVEEAHHGPHPFRLVAPLGDRHLEAPLRKAG